MDRRLQLIAHLYDEDLEGLEPLGSLLQDPDLRREYEALGETRFRVEQGTRRRRPDPVVLDRVVERALRGIPGAAPRDRPAARILPLRRAWLPAVAVAASLLLVLVVRPWRQADSALPATETLSDAASEKVAPELSTSPKDVAGSSEALLMDLPPAPPTTLASAEAEPQDGPEWDTGDEVRLLSRRIATLRDIPLDAWDGPAVPLEALPSGRDALLSPAGATRPRY